MLLILLVVWVGLCLLMGAGAIYLQSYLNETPPDLKELAWRAPAAGTLVAVFMGIWCALATGNPDRWAALTEFSPTAESEYFPKLRKTSNGQSWEVFLQRNAQGKQVYLPANGAVLPERSGPHADEIVVVEDGQEVKFLPERDRDNKIIVDSTRGGVRYRDAQGRIMDEIYLGRITTVRTGWWFSYILLNLIHGVVWLAAAWPLMRFSFWQAVAITVVAWGVSTLFVMPPLLQRARKIHDDRVKVEQAGANENRREDLAALPPVSGVRLASPHGPDRAPRGAPGRVRVIYLDATDGVISILTFTSWPARTETRSVLVWPFISAAMV
jgi:hypothetical protein